MGNLVDRQPRSFPRSRSASQRPFRKRRWHLLFRWHAGPKANPHAVHLVKDHANIRALGTGLFVRRGKDMGNELDHGIPEDLEPRMSMTRRKFTVVAGATVLAGWQATPLQEKSRRISLVLAPSNLGLRPTESGGQPGTWRAPQVLMDAGLVRA